MTAFALDEFNDLPFESIIPYDISGKETDINPDNLGKTVQLIIDDLGGD